MPLWALAQTMAIDDHADDAAFTIYHEAYALVTWMARFRRDELRRYLIAMACEPPGRPEPMRQLELFEQAFGDCDRLEKAWLRYERDHLEPPAAGDIARMSQPHAGRSAE
jgi:hypothetical protein